MPDTFIPSINFQSLAPGQRKILFVVIHHSVGTANSDIPTLTKPNPHDPNKSVSCHRYVTRGGDRYKFVEDKDVAWTCGVSAAERRPTHPMGTWVSDLFTDGRPHNENFWSLNIEMENLGTQDFTDAQYAASADWVADWIVRYNIAPDRNSIIGHRELTTNPEHQDPNNKWDWTRFMSMVLERLAANPAYIDPVVKGPATISRAAFRQILTAGHSPVAPDSDAAYDLCNQFGVNPVIPLAFFQKESSLGTDGIARQTRNWGNLIPHAWGRASGTLGGFASYNSWLDSLADYCELLSSPARLYASEGRTTICRIIPRYCPPFDGTHKNDTPLYIRQTVDRITGWSDIQPAAPVVDDFPLVAQPTLTRAQFTGVLQQFNSPALGSADNDYTVCTANNVNPAVALAFFVQTSQCGTAFSRGSAADHNWGNLFDPPDFAQFHHAETWEQGVRDWCVRLVAQAQGSWGPTISTIVPHYFNLQPGPSPILSTISGLIKGWKETFDQQAFVIGAAPEAAGPRDLGAPEDTDALIEGHGHADTRGDEDDAVPESASRDLVAPEELGLPPPPPPMVPRIAEPEAPSPRQSRRRTAAAPAATNGKQRGGTRTRKS